jgi:hypothetical protein
MTVFSLYFITDTQSKTEYVSEKTDELGEGIEFLCLKCEECSKSRTALCYLHGVLAMARTNEQKCRKILNCQTLNLDSAVYITALKNQYQFELW